MTPDAMLVGPELIEEAGLSVDEGGPLPCLLELADQEPALADFISQRLVSLSGMIALSGAPTQLVCAAHENMAAILMVCVRALQRGHYELWKGTEVGKQLDQLMKTECPGKDSSRESTAEDKEC